LLLLNDLAVVGRVVNNSWLNPETLLLLNIASTGDEVVALVFAVLEESLDLLILIILSSEGIDRIFCVLETYLHLVLGRAQHDTLLVG
jgi:hypothetical protein